MKIQQILPLGDTKLYEVSTPVLQEEVAGLQPVIQDLQDIILEVRAKYGFGRGIAAPQIGVMKRLICLNLNNQTYTLINPVLSDLSEEMMELWDDCMCFPNLLVRLQRHRFCKITFWDENWQSHTWELKDDLAELLQHEYDHLDGILATQRAIDDKSFKWRF
jgi:peptide deformylase